LAFNEEPRSQSVDAAGDSRKEIARLSRRVRRLEEMLAQVELIRDTNAHLLDRLMKELAAERARSRELLLNVLPEMIVGRLERGETLIADRHDRVAVLLSDFVSFTEISSRLAPDVLVTQLNELFTAFDAAASMHGVEKVETIGDAYLAAGGLDDGPDDPCASVARVALAMLEAVVRTEGAWHIRIGIHIGPAVAGVIGTRKFSYHVWGDTVNTASRLETSASTDHIQVSEPVARALEHDFVLEARGPTALKGKGEMNTWYLVGER
jgi:adenylate cyclase